MRIIKNGALTAIALLNLFTGVVVDMKQLITPDGITNCLCREAEVKHHVDSNVEDSQQHTMIF